MILNNVPEIKKILIEVDTSLHRQLKSTAAATGHTMKQIISTAIAHELALMTMEVKINDMRLNEITKQKSEKSRKIRRRVKKINSNQNQRAKI